jgi:ABC transport system ATP-binding/permease protein
MPKIEEPIETRNKTMLLAAEKISKNYSERMLLSEVSLYLNEGDKVGVIGVNGTGKSTFLRIIAGAEFADSGLISKNPGVRIAYLPQNPIFDEDLTVIEQVFRGTSAHEQELKEYEAKAILNRLGIMDYDQPIVQLSGGQKKRVAIASSLIRPCELLILDEPTNHLDNAMVQWLEDYLIRYRGAILMVTHDRYFLDRITNKIVEIDHGSLYTYDANYSGYLELQAQREEMAIAGERKRQAILKKELAWIQRGARARSTKSKGRIERFEELRDRDGIARKEKLDLSSVTSRLGRKTIEIDHVSKGYEGENLIRDFSMIILRDARIGIIGPNGCGKSTLLNMINGTIGPDSGTIDIGDTVRIGYFSQECEEMDLTLRVIDYIRNVAENIQTTDGILTASQMLEKFLFPADLQWNVIGRLSGGERRRLFLLRIIMDAPNILLLDEPTNDLDIQTLAILEDYLEGFGGAVVVVSHDRYFLDKVVDRVFAFEGNGEIHQYIGGYSDYLDELEEELKNEKDRAAKEQSKAQKDQSKGSKEQGSATALGAGKIKIKFSYKEQLEFEAIDDEIAALEQQIEGVEKALVAESSNYEKLQELTIQRENLDQKLELKMERWVYLNDLAEQMK